MFDFSVDEDSAAAVETARRFAEEHLEPQLRASEAARTPSAGVQALAEEIGFTRLHWPLEAGGAGLGWLARVQVLEALATGDGAAAFALNAYGLAADALLAFGGPALLSTCGLGPSASDTRAVLVVNEREGVRCEGGRARGCLPWVPADRVDLLLLLDQEGLTVVRTGLQAVPLPGAGLRAAGASELSVDGAIECRLQDPRAAARALAMARLQTAALMLGEMQAAATYSRRYAGDRVAFGKPIAHHQALAFLIVDMQTAVDAARMLVHEAAWRADQGLPFEAASAAAWVEAIEAGMFVGPNAVQILGAAGFMRDFPVEKHMRELRTLGLLCGGVDAAKRDALLGAEPDGFEPLAREA